ncbi:hypothetical protein LOK49_LG02G01861 [Camellia lanceoleosa]|uniref:Uncharacterized protein n=1 Tax=Camellia lanceoleosa TaxID=1840588 RepID=A0ACC0IRW6_9ERIC|nr:hypothetical protein LOK49_LG02G01861 [Camellia lanceoleosa]
MGSPECEQPQTVNSNSNGEEQDHEQRSVVGSKEGEEVGGVEDHGGGEIWTTQLILRAKGLRVGNDDHSATDRQLREQSISRVEESILSIGQLDCLQKQPSGGGEAGGYLSDQSGPTPIQIQTEGNQIVVGDVVTPGFMKSLSGPEKDAPGLNLEVLLSKAHVSQCGNLLGHRYSELSDPKDQLVEEDEVQNSKDIAAHDSVVKEFFGVATCSTATADQTRKISIKEKGKGMVKYQRKKKGDIQIGVGSVLNFRKGAIFRAAVAAISLSMASKSASSQMILNERRLRR